MYGQQSDQPASVHFNNQGAKIGQQGVFQQSSVHFNNQGLKIGQQGIFHITHNYRDAPPVDPGLRRRLLDTVYKVWIKKFIEPFQQGATFIPLGLYDEPELAENPWKDISQETG